MEEFEGRMNAKVRKQEKLDVMKKKDFRRGELPGKYMAKMLYGWDDGEFEEEYLRNLENGSQFLQKRNLEGGVMSKLKIVNSNYFYFIFDLVSFILFLEPGLEFK